MNLPAVRRRGHLAHMQHAYREHFADHRRERQFLVAVGFLGAFAVTRAVTHAIKAGKGPFHDIGGDDGTHIHHMTFGIIGNLVVGYLWVWQLGTHPTPSAALSRGTSLAFGVCAALTLDEFALWLNLEDDYWTDKGRESIDAVVLFGGVLVLGALSGGIGPKYLRRAREERLRVAGLGRTTAAIRSSVLGSGG